MSYIKSYKKKWIGGLLLASASFSTSAAVISFDDDDNDIQDGTISYDGVGGSLVGSGIDLHSILGQDTPSNPGSSLDCIGCVLSFSTGSNISEGPVVWEFNSGGLLTIAGTVKDSGGTTIASGNLVSGTFASATITGDGNNNSVLIMAGFGSDTKNEDLLTYFGMSGLDFTFASTNISLGNVTYGDGGVNGPIGSFNGTVTNADFDNTAVVPIPATVWLFGSGLLGLVGIARRKKVA